MTNKYISKEELEKVRTPYDMWDWLIQKVNYICSTEDGRRAFRLQNDKEKFIKKLNEEIAPLAIFGKLKFGSTDKVLLQPVIGNQNYDAKVIDKRTERFSLTYVEITQSHEGEDDYWRRLELYKKGVVFTRASVIKTGKGKNRLVSIPAEATDVEKDLENELNRILEALRRKAGRDYPPNTSLIVFFDDTGNFEEALKLTSKTTIDCVIKKEITKLDLRFSNLYLVGKAKKIFKEYSVKE